MNPAQNQRYFKIGEAAKILGLSCETLRRWEKAGRVSFSRTPGGKRLFSEADLESVRHLLEPTHALPAGRQESTQTSTYQSSDSGARQSERITLTVSVPKIKLPKFNFNFTKIALACFILALLLGNVFLFSKSPYFHPVREIVSDRTSQAVLGVETFIAPALQESAPLGNFISKAAGLVNKLKEKSFVIPFVGKNEFASVENLEISGKGHITKDLQVDKNLDVKGTATVGKLVTGIVDPYLIENDGSVQSTLEIKSIGDIKLEPGSSKVDLDGSSLSSVKNITATGDISANTLTLSGTFTASKLKTTGDLTVDKNITLTGVINSTRITDNKLLFGGDSPSIYAGTTNTGISLNANGTGAISIGNSSTGDIYLGGGTSSSSRCVITNSNGNLTCSGDLAVNGGDITGGTTTFNLLNSTVTTLNVGGAATTISIGASTGTTTVNNALTITGAATLSSTLSVTGTSTFTGNLTINGRPTFTKVPSSAHTGTWAIDSSTWNVSDAAVYVNPASATADSNLLGVAVNGNVKFDVDAEGDIFGRNLVLTGNTTTGTTTVSGDLTVEGNTILGDATTDTLTINPATVTFSGGNKTLDLTGAATRTLTLLNSTVSQVADLDLSDGSLKLNSTTIISNAGALSSITGFTQSSGTHSVTSTTTSGDVTSFTDTSLSAASSNLTNFTFKNANTGAGVSLNGVTITEQAAGTPSSGTNTSNLLNLSAAAGGTVNGINISSATGFTNFFKTPTFNLDSSGNVSGVVTLTATTLAGTLSTAAQTNVTSVGTLTSLTVTGNINSSSGSLQSNGVTRIDNSGNITAGTGSFGGAVTPSLDNTYDFGSAVLRWKDAYFAGDVTAGDLVFKNNFRLTENGDKGINILNPKGEVIGGFDDQGNFWVKGEIKHGTGN